LAHPVRFVLVQQTVHSSDSNYIFVLRKKCGCGSLVKSVIIGNRVTEGRNGGELGRHRHVSNVNIAFTCRLQSISHSTVAVGDNTCTAEAIIIIIIIIMCCRPTGEVRMETIYINGMHILYEIWRH